MDYDDDLELTRYVWNNCARLLTPFEQRAGQPMVHRAKGATNPKLSTHPRWAELTAADDPAIDAALVAGPEAFRRQVRERLLAEAGDQITIDRCPSCTRILRTPLAQQCLWCGHDWHEAS